MSEATLDSVEAVVAVLGGPRAVRELTGRTPQSVWNWRQKGSFPARHHALMKGELERLGYAADDSLWGQS